MNNSFGGAAKKKEGKTEKGTGAEDRGELKLEQVIIDLVWALIWPRHWPNKRPSVAEHYKAFGIQEVGSNIQECNIIHFVLLKYGIGGSGSGMAQIHPRFTRVTHYSQLYQVALKPWPMNLNPHHLYDQKEAKPSESQAK
ncbi:hypothetical protein C8J57DRAFT_1230567 [Mycena rebaudengoi]|nr:hypothetical protein C8J57DRAFT_1230567 [Mycena rebaudengoi]